MSSVMSGNASRPDFSRVPGTVIAHAPAQKKIHIGSPSIAVLPSGEYIATHDHFGVGSTWSRSFVYGSTDRGAS